jgi:hypothetical protein
LAGIQKQSVNIKTFKKKNKFTLSLLEYSISLGEHLILYIQKSLIKSSKKDQRSWVSGFCGSNAKKGWRVLYASLHFTT